MQMDCRGSLGRDHAPLSRVIGNCLISHVKAANIVVKHTQTGQTLQWTLLRQYL